MKVKRFVECVFLRDTDVMEKEKFVGIGEFMKWVEQLSNNMRIDHVAQTQSCVTRESQKIVNVIVITTVFYTEVFPVREPPRITVEEL